MATLFSPITAIHPLRTLPLDSLYPSALVDFVLLFAGAKPVVRVELRARRGAAALASWCRHFGLHYAGDSDGFACISADENLPRRVLEMDRSVESHEADLGQALGYPSCCCQRVAQIGESQIDQYASQVAQWRFTGRYARINPAGYGNGLSLLSHLPCAVDCDRSLTIAEQACHFIREHSNEPMLTALAGSPLVLMNTDL